MSDFEQITILGMGLIGGSIAMKLKNSGYNGKTIGQDVSLSSLEMAKMVGAIDEYTISLEEAVGGSDLVILAVPMGYYEEVLKKITPHLKANAIITDVGSVKKHAINLFQKYLPENIQFLGGHPMSGSEKSGMGAASPFLLENAFYFLTPTEKTTSDTVEKVKDFIESLGAFPVITSADEHDHIVALISHIPHVMAGMLVNLIGRNNNSSFLPYAGGGLRDTTRIASGNPSMWKDILLMNREEVVKGIEELEHIMKDFKESLIRKDRVNILSELSKAKETRDSIPKRMKDAIPVLFEIYLDVADIPGTLGKVTQILGQNKINIKEIEIVHAREDKNGALRMGFSKADEQKSAMDILVKTGYRVTWHDEEVQN